MELKYIIVLGAVAVVLVATVIGVMSACMLSSQISRREEKQ